MARNAASKVVRLVAFAALAGLGTTACGVDELGEVGAGGGGDVPERVVLAFEESCAVVMCHDAGSSPQGNLTLTRGAIDAILTKESTQEPGLPLVKLGDVGGSVIGRKLLDRETLSALYGEERVGGQMPPPTVRGPEDDENVLVILAWIAGATIPPPDDGMGTDSGGFDDEPWAEGPY